MLKVLICIYALCVTASMVKAQFNFREISGLPSHQKGYFQSDIGIDPQTLENLNQQSNFNKEQQSIINSQQIFKSNLEENVQTFTQVPQKPEFVQVKQPQNTQNVPQVPSSGSFAPIHVPDINFNSRQNLPRRSPDFNTQQQNNQFNPQRIASTNFRQTVPTSTNNVQIIPNNVPIMTQNQVQLQSRNNGQSQIFSRVKQTVPGSVQNVQIIRQPTTFNSDVPQKEIFRNNLSKQNFRTSVQTEPQNNFQFPQQHIGAGNVVGIIPNNQFNGANQEQIQFDPTFLRTGSVRSNNQIFQQNFEPMQTELLPPINNAQVFNDQNTFTTVPPISRTVNRKNPTVRTRVISRNKQQQLPTRLPEIQTNVDVPINIDEEENRRQAENAHYSFSSSFDDTISDNSQFRQEKRDGLKLEGLYSYKDGFFKRTVHYVADENGYRVVKEESEPIGHGPQIDPTGKIEVNSNVDGAQLQYTLTAKDIPSLQSAFSQDIDTRVQDV